MEHIDIKMDKFILEILKIIVWMVKDNTIGLIMTIIKGNFQIIKDMEMDI
jgi:hypothetical protein